MRLSNFTESETRSALERMHRGLAGRDPAQAVLARIMTATAWLAPGELHESAIAFCRSWGLPLLDAAPADHFSWDGTALALVIEPTVLVHEVAHFQVCAPDRRHLIDFGLGAGPETGRKQEADADQRLSGVEADLEEALASMLGILWEIELGHPAMDAFLEQNWLEGGDRPANLAHFEKICRRLFELGLIDEAGCPQRRIRRIPDEAFYAPLLA
jgi:hypothetical protein